jgi:long-chain fatty acid transport protein
MGRPARVAAWVLLTLGMWPGLVSAQGVIAPGAGPINRAMAGASTAAPVDFGASYWNPATLSGLEQDEVLIGSELILPSIHFQSIQPAGSINGVLPTSNRFGTARSNSGVASNLATGASWRMTPDSPLTFGIGIFGLVGGGVNFAGSYTTPVLGPRQPPNNFGLGPVAANLSFLQIKPMLSLQATDRLAVAFAPTIVSGAAAFTPAFFAPGPADQYGIPTFPVATNSRPFWGAGFELGLLYNLNDSWNIGFSYKSPVWLEKWYYNSYNPNLSPRQIGLQAGVPPIYSWGVAYKGVPGLLVDVDLRYFDYANTPLWGQRVIDGGLNWNSIFAVATGVQYQATDKLTLRGGYLYNTNPVNAPQTLFNIQAPGIVTNTLSLGLSMRMTEQVTMSAAWVHGFRNSESGPIGQIPGSSARLDAQLESLVVGLTIQYGAKRKVGMEPAAPALAPPPPPVQVSQAEPTP